MNNDLPPEFIELLKSVKNKRAKLVIDTILENGFITTEELIEQGYEHAPRAARDVRELGIPLETFKIESFKGKKIAAYKFGDLNKVRNNVLQGRKIFPKDFKEKIAKINGQRCEICQTSFELRYLQIDHKIPYEVYGDTELYPENYMLLCSSCNRSKSWSCEQCTNWLDKKDPKICKTCYWASPHQYSHIAMKEIRRVDLTFTEDNVYTHDELKKIAEEKGITIQEYIIRFLKD